MVNPLKSLLLSLIASVIFGTYISAMPPPPGMVHIRGAIKSLQGHVLIIQSVQGPVKVLYYPKTPIASLVPSDRMHIKNGSFLGIASVSGTDGLQRAHEVVVFPEAARGTGEGSYPWDLPGGGASHSKMTNGTAVRSKMTNGTAIRSRMTNGTVHQSGHGDALILQYKSGTGIGSQTITLPPGIPIVTFAPGQLTQLTPGAHVFVIAHPLSGGMLAADRILVGKNGLVPPM